MKSGRHKHRVETEHIISRITHRWRLHRLFLAHPPFLEPTIRQGLPCLSRTPQSIVLGEAVSNDPFPELETPCTQPDCPISLLNIIIRCSHSNPFSNRLTAGFYLSALARNTSHMWMRGNRFEPPTCQKVILRISYASLLENLKDSAAHF